VKINRYEIQEYGVSGFRVIDKLNDCYVCVPLAHKSKEVLAEIMGRDMDVMVDSKDVHPAYFDNTV